MRITLDKLLKKKPLFVLKKKYLNFCFQHNFFLPPVPNANLIVWVRTNSCECITIKTKGWITIRSFSSFPEYPIKTMLWVVIYVNVWPHTFFSNSIKLFIWMNWNWTYTSTISREKNWVFSCDIIIKLVAYSWSCDPSFIINKPKIISFKRVISKAIIEAEHSFWNWKFLWFMLLVIFWVKMIFWNKICIFFWLNFLLGSNHGLL